MTRYLNHTLAAFHRVRHPQQHPVSQEGSVGSCQPEVCVGIGLEDKCQPRGLSFMLLGRSWAQVITTHCPSPRQHGTILAFKSQPTSPLYTSPWGGWDNKFSSVSEPGVKPSSATSGQCGPGQLCPFSESRFLLV